MAATRSKSGIAKPRQVAYEIGEAIKAPKKKATKKAPAAKANESKPRTKVAGKVTKPKKATSKATAAPVAKKAAAKKTKPKTEAAGAEPNHEPTLLEKAEGVALTVQGYIMGKPGKKAAGTAKIRGTSRKGTSAKTAKVAA